MSLSGSLGPTGWPCRHGGPGSYDERPRRASHEELAVAELLVAEGHHVRTVAEGRAGRTPDLLACGVSVEVKSFRSLEERQGRAPSPISVANKILDASRQGAVAVIWGPASGLSKRAAQSGYNVFCEQAASKGLGRPTQVRIVGQGFDLKFSPVADIRAEAPRHSRPVPSPQLKGALGRRSPQLGA